MKTFFKNKSFRWGFLLAFLSLLSLNFVSFLQYRNQVDEINGINRTSDINLMVIHCFGFPLPIFYGQDYAFDGIWWRGLVFNILVGFVFSVIVGLLFAFIQSRTSASKIGLK